MTARTCLSLLVLVLGAARAAAQEATPIPDFTGERVRVAGVPDNYGSLRDEIRRLEASSGRTYYVVVVASSGSGPTATHDYTTRLGETWARQAADRALKLDPDRSVLVVMAVNNRQVSVHPGTVLRTKYGLTEKVLDQELVQPHFTPLARKGEYPEALRALLIATDRWVVAKDAPPPPPQPAPAPVEKAPVRDVVMAADPAVPGAPAPREGHGAGWWAGVVGIVLAVLFGLQSLRYLLVRRSTVRRFEGFRERVMRLREGVEAVRERHRLLTASDKGYTEPMAGQTLAVFQQVKADADRLWDAWLQKMEVWERVQLLVRAGRFPRVGPLSEAGRLLGGLGALEEVERQHAACAGDMGRLEKAHEQAQADLRAAEEVAAGLRKQLETVRQAPLPTAPYEGDLEACATLAERARGEMRADPLGAQATLAEARKKGTDLGGRMEQVLAQLRRSRQVHEGLQESAHRVAEARAGGLLLTETGGNPDPLLEQGHGRHDEALAALRRGEPVAGAEQLDRAAALAEEARGLIDRQAAARARCREQIPALRTEAVRLRQAAAEAQRQRDELERAFAPESWKDVAGNVARAEGLLRAAVPLLDQADAAAADRVQHYFQAAGLLDQVQQHQREADGLLGAVGPCLQGLTRLRQECQAADHEIDHLRRRVEQFIDANEMAIRRGGRDLWGAAETHRHEASRAMAALRPNWQAVRERLAEAQRGFTAALQEAEKDVRSHQDFLAQLGEAERRAGIVADFLDRHEEIRPRAGQRYRAGCATLERARHDSRTPHADWVQMLGQVKEAAGALDEAQRWAEEDVRLAQQAAAEVREAERELEQARSYSSMGVRADVTAAQGRLAEGQGHLDGQSYEKAIECAGAARRAARAAYDEAVSRANQAQGRMQGAALAPSAPPPPPQAEAPAPPAEGSGNPPGPWSTGTSQSSW